MFFESNNNNNCWKIPQDDIAKYPTTRIELWAEPNIPPYNGWISTFPVTSTPSIHLSSLSSGKHKPLTQRSVNGIYIQ